ncbi:MAG TPA: choice-of-anchor D domain-containing protein, partial [Kofleriaceae bacterium]|nr:choice-of-anchor D domain-containing protein [Kofleriaceae bacterium]
MRIRRFAAMGIVAASACMATYATTEQHVVIVDVSTYNFGTVAVGQSSTSSTITISPQTQTDDDNVTAIAFQSACPNFALNLSQPLPAHIYCDGSAGMARTAAGSGTQSCIPHVYAFTATFTPSFAGTQSCNVRIDYAPTGSGSGSGGSTFVMLTGTGMATANSWTVSPLQLLYGDVPVSQPSSPQPVTIMNTGTQALTIMGTVSNTSVFGVGGAPLSSHSLAAGASETYQVTCTPNSATMFNATLTFTGTNVATQTVALSCRGITTTLNVSPNPAIFAYTLVGRSPADRTVTINNGGSASVTISNFRVGAGASTDLTITSSPGTTTLLNGGSAQVVLHYAATKPNLGSLGTIVFDTGSATSQNIAVSGDAQVGSIGTNPASIELGPVCVGATMSKQLAIFANAPGKVDVSSIGAPASTQIAVPTVAGTLQGNHANELTVTATLTATTPAPIDDKLLINSNLPAEPMIDVPIHGVVLPAGIGASPELVHFGPVMLDTTTTAKEIVISNCSPSPLTVSAASIGGVDAREFAIVSPAD